MASFFDFEVPQDVLYRFTLEWWHDRYTLAQVKNVQLVRLEGVSGSCGFQLLTQLEKSMYT